MLGRSNVVFLHFYAKESDWARHAPVFEQMAAGFRRTPDQTVTIGTRTVTTDGKTVGGGFDWSRVGSKPWPAPRSAGWWVRSAGLRRGRRGRSDPSGAPSPA